MKKVLPPLYEDDVEDLFENAPCGILSTLLDGTIIRANRTLLEWTGLDRDQLIGRKRFQDLLTAGGSIFYETHYAPLLRMQGVVREIAVDVKCPEGRTLPVLTNSVLKRDDDGNPVAIRTAVFRATDRRKYEQELLSARMRAEESEAKARSLAQTLQSTFIPPAPPSISGLEIGAVYRPSGAGDEVGGDFYDVFETARDRWAVVIGDVCGKGAEAATLTALARYTIRATAMRTKRPSAVLEGLNKALLRHPSDRFCTVVYAGVRARPDGHLLVRFASGGHPLPVYASGDDRVHAVGRHGTILGIVIDPVLRDASVDMDPGDVLVFYTDGVTEARGDGKFFGSERLESLVSRHRDDDAGSLARRIVDEVVNLQRGNPRDDIVVVVLKASETDAETSKRR